MGSVEIRVLSSAAECAEMEAVQLEVWDRGVLMPAPHLLASIGTGGIALGAYDAGRAVGFCWGFPAVRHGRVWLHSHMLGVIPAYRRSGLGQRLKLMQRVSALEAGYELVTWTFDPLRVGNAVLNLERLGAVGTDYVPDYYGRLADPLNRDLPTDRLMVSWHLRSPRVTARVAGNAPRGTPPDAPVVNPVETDAAAPRSAAPDLGLTAGTLLVAVPADIDRLKASAPGLARDWRLKTRAALEHYLARGYVVNGIETAGDVALYVLEAGWTDENR